jgi:hypothetical protein
MDLKFVYNARSYLILFDLIYYLTPLWVTLRGFLVLKSGVKFYHCLWRLGSSSVRRYYVVLWNRSVLPEPDRGCTPLMTILRRHAAGYNLSRLNGVSKQQNNRSINQSTTTHLFPETSLLSVCSYNYTVLTTYFNVSTCNKYVMIQAAPLGRCGAALVAGNRNIHK